MGSIRIVRGSDIPAQPSAVSTERWTRKVLDVDDRITIIVARNPPRAISGWHQHGENLVCVYVQQGTVRLEWGPAGRESAELSTGDFYIISPHTVHCEANPASAEQVLIALVVGAPPKFVEVDGADPDAGSIHGAGSIRVIRAGDLPAGPPTAGMERKAADVDELVSVAGACIAPGTFSAWHHHGEGTVCAYLVQGDSHVEWGRGGRESADLSAGDFYFISPNTIHREGNPGTQDQVLAAFLLGRGFRAMNVEGPEAE
jgi:uncharacterized RmlC-like cupin family protein